MERKKIEESYLTADQRKYLLAFKGRLSLGSFGDGLVAIWKIADLGNQRELAKGFPEFAEGYRLWLSGEYK
jgi:hypothetical protein